MASTLETYNNIQISQNTFKLLQDNTEGLHFEPKSPEVKGKGKMKTFLVEPAQTSSDDLQVFTDFSETHPTNPTLKTMSLSTMLKRNEESFSNQDLIKSFNANLTWRQKLFQVLCVETEAEKQFQSLIYQNSYLMQKYGLMVSASVTGFLIVLSSVQYKCSIEYHSLPRLIYFVFEESLTLIFLFFIQKFYKSRIFAYMLNSLYWTEMVLFLILQFIYPNDKSVDLLLFSFRYLLLNFCTGLFFLRSTISNLSLIAVLILKLFFFSPSIETWFFSSFFVLCILHTTFTRETNLRKDYIVRYLLERENEKTEQLLTQMLPFKALRNLKDEITSVDRLSSVTIMYADIVGFTLWSAQRSPADVIGMLSEMFTKFDKMCVEHGLYKVYTIGDCYVAMGHFTDQVKRNPAKEAAQIARFAFSLVKLIQEVNVKISACLNMRIGIHTGNAVGGINGTNVVRYDVYGKDVMIANKMESHGVPGKVTVSEKTKELIEGIDEQEFSFEEFKDVKAWDETVKMFIMNRVK
jgi:phospholipid-translocating ATPase